MQRRRILTAVTASMLAGTLVAPAGVRAAASLGRTGSDSEGPFYPVVPIPLNSNLVMGDGVSGEMLRLHGRVLDTDGNPQPDLRVEIWQCDANSIYRHPAAGDQSGADSLFRGFGAVVTDSAGAYGFDTIVPVAYPGRPPHIHAKLWRADEQLLTTQIYLQGERGPDSRKMDPQAEGDRYLAGFDFVIKG